MLSLQLYCQGFHLTFGMPSIKSNLSCNVEQFNGNLVEWQMICGFRTSIDDLQILSIPLWFIGSIYSGCSNLQLPLWWVIVLMMILDLVWLLSMMEYDGTRLSFKPFLERINPPFELRGVRWSSLCQKNWFEIYGVSDNSRSKSLHQLCLFSSGTFPCWWLDGIPLFGWLDGSVDPSVVITSFVITWADYLPL